MTTTPALPAILTRHVAAVNAFDEEAIAATFAEDALVNDAHREFRGIEAIRRWVAREIIGDKVTLQVTDVTHHYGDTIIRARYDGEYDKTNLPGELILTSYLTVRDDKIVTMIIIRNTPADY
jgi:SnoaL-like domain